MSVFDPNTETEGDSDPFETLVGEGKKFKTPQDLAKGKLESDKFIRDLERQISEMKEDLDKSSKIEELLELARSQQKDKAAQSPPSGNENREDNDGGTGDPNDTSSGLTDERLKALIESQLSTVETARSRQNNLKEVDAILEEKFGETAKSFLKTKSSEIGMSIDELKDLASRNPKAFFQLTGVTVGGVPNRNQSVTVGSSRSDGTAVYGGKSENRDFAYYQKLRKENKKQYYNSATQAQMYKDVKEIPKEIFYRGYEHYLNNR